MWIDIDTKNIPSRFIAILFLLIADERLWKVSKHSIEQNGFDLKQVCLREINTDGYAFYQTAKIISTGKECIRINELEDKDLIDDFIFKAIINSVLINRYGIEMATVLNCYIEGSRGEQMKIYFDMNIYNRVFDDQTQMRIRFESMAIDILFETRR